MLSAGKSIFCSSFFCCLYAVLSADPLADTYIFSRGRADTSCCKPLHTFHVKEAESMAKRYEELTFTDDFMFCKVLQNNPDICKELAELILGKKIGVRTM